MSHVHHTYRLKRALPHQHNTMHHHQLLHHRNYQLPARVNQWSSRPLQPLQCSPKPTAITSTSGRSESTVFDSHHHHKLNFHHIHRSLVAGQQSARSHLTPTQPNALSHRQLFHTGWCYDVDCRCHSLTHSLTPHNSHQIFNLTTAKSATHSIQIRSEGQ